MFLSLSELQSGIELARNQLITAAEYWIETQHDVGLNPIKRAWLTAVKSPNREEMQRALQKENVPLLRTEQFVAGVSSPDSSTSSLTTPGAESFEDGYYRSYYQPVDAEPEAYLLRLSHLTTVFELLFQLHDYLSSSECFVPLSALELAHAMGISMNQEWCHVKSGKGTVHLYSSRLEVAREQFLRANTFLEHMLEMHQIQINIRVRQFAATLSFLVSTLCATYALEHDSRHFLARLFRTYHPWHSLLHQLSVSLFGTDAVMHPDKNSMVIWDAKTVELAGLVRNHMQTALDAKANEFHRLVHATQLQLDEFTRKLENMSSNLAVSKRLGAMHQVAVHLPTGIGGFYGFFNQLERLPCLSHRMGGLVDVNTEEVIDAKGFRRTGIS
ncbi:hypothetical protein [Legionella worsleiensis]|uniref:Uncharacterized protein n=1 Tax=Legionella worsleiensis TaxID=45076 RepID=A0A0W1AFR4_9GAMM|nr:hypothetical protein [Legionella worsleiensis]KTD80205.1 hypothetical protein Lwor_1113 [Legionella worsleiensis]STY31739.1 Uncharacterised protein [Legionella worsleiensis]